MFQRTFRFKLQDIDAAFAEGQFSLAYQPKVHLACDRITGAEAFVRWRHPDFGLIPPGLFLQFLDQQDRMGDLTRYVMREAFKAAKLWHKSGQSWTVSVNLSVSDLHDETIVPFLEELLSGGGVAPDTLILELPQAITYLGPDRRMQDQEIDGTERRADTETSQAWDKILETVYGITALGARVSLDGGGNAISALEMFEPQPFTEIKIGGDAIRQIAHAHTAPQYGLTMDRMRFASDLGYEVVAMGVEDEATMRAVRDAGFTAAQGNLLGRPMPALSLFDWNHPTVKKMEGQARQVRGNFGSGPAAQVGKPAPSLTGVIGEKPAAGGRGKTGGDAAGPSRKTFGQRRRTFH